MDERQIKVTDRTRSRDQLWACLSQHPDLVRALFEARFYPAPWLGWVPMLCELLKGVK